MSKKDTPQEKLNKQLDDIAAKAAKDFQDRQDEARKKAKEQSENRK